MGNETASCHSQDLQRARFTDQVVIPTSKSHTQIPKSRADRSAMRRGALTILFSYSIVKAHNLNISFHAHAHRDFAPRTGPKLQHEHIGHLACSLGTPGRSRSRRQKKTLTPYINWRQVARSDLALLPLDGYER